MTRTIATMLVGLAVTVAPVWAQSNPRVEISVNGGYTLSEGIPVNSETVAGVLIDRVTPKSGGLMESWRTSLPVSKRKSDSSSRSSSAHSS